MSLNPTIDSPCMRGVRKISPHHFHPLAINFVRQIRVLRQFMTEERRCDPFLLYLTLFALPSCVYFLSFARLFAL
jgi:hypothetical protein